MDAVSLDRLLDEVRPALVGRHLGRVRGAAAQAVVFEISGVREARLWCDAGRATAGLYLLTREQAGSLRDEAALAGRSRQAVLLLRKHLEGRRVSGLRRVSGRRVVLLEAGEAVLVLRLFEPPALTLAVGGQAVAQVGQGSAAWPPPAEAPEREWDRVDAAAVDAVAARARATGGSAVRAVLEACPDLGPQLARLVDGTPGAFAALRERLRAPRPTLLAPGPLEECHDLDLAAAEAVTLVPLPIELPGRVALTPPTWREAAAILLQARLRGQRFAEERRAALDAGRREARRLAQLATHLEGDLAGLPAAEDLRHWAEALLASATGEAPGAAEIEVADPYRPEARLRVALDPRLGLAANAERLFDKARRVERARVQVQARLADTQARLAQARSVAAAVEAGRDLRELRELIRESGLGTPARRAAGGRRAEPAAGPRHYLSSRGLSILVGRGARQNHHLTFALAGPEDFWLHARDVPGAHVIVRDREGRASPEDLREAAELAAFFSEAARQPQVDVHVVRRKHVRAARGGPGRVRVAHSETLRVTPRDPGGRLRQR